MPGIESLLGALPLFCLLLTIFCLRKTAAHPFDALMRGSLVWAFALVMVSNILSALTLLSFPWLLIYWIVYSAFFALRLYREKPARLVWPKPDGHMRVLACIALLTLITATLYPPTTVDTMTYHLPKVMHWQQNNSLEHYYTSILRQTGLSPFAELVVFHSFVLSGTDALANLAQWSAFIGIICVAAATAALLGAGKTGQTLAALFFATLPMGIAQASSTQTDLVVGFWLMCMAARFLIWKSEASTSNAAYFGMAVGMAVLTKGTGYIISFPFVIAFAVFSMKQYRLLLSKAILSGVIALSIFLPHAYKNYIAYDNPFIGSDWGKYTSIIPRPTVRSFIATAVAHIISNFPIPFMQHDIDQAYEALLTVLDIDPKDPVIFSYGPVSERRKLFSTHESQAQNPVHLILFIWCVSGIGIRHYASANRYRWLLLASLTLFCLFLSWNYWTLRYQPPLFALAAPLIGFALEKSCGEKTRRVFCILLVLYCIPVLSGNWSRPLLPPACGANPFSVWTQTREQLYFSERPERSFRERYLAAADILAKERAESIGLVIGEDSWEYPLWALLRARVSVMPRIRHVIPPETDDASPVVPPAFAPQYLFVLERRLAWETRDEITEDPRYAKRLWIAWEKNPDEIKAPLRLFKRVNGRYLRIF